MSSSSPSIGAIAAATCLLVGVGPPSNRQGPPQVLPTGQTDTIDFRAVSALGSPIVDLTAADVSISVAGQWRAIRSLELVRDVDDVRTMPEPAGPKTPPAAVLPLPFATNAGPGRGRTFYLLVDEASITPDDVGLLQSAIGAFLTDLPPGDEVAVATILPGARRVQPTTDRGRVSSAFAGLMGLGSTTESPASVNTRSARCLRRLDQLLGALRGSERPPVIVVVSTGLSIPQPAENLAIRGAGSRPPSASPGGQREAVAPVDLEQIRLAAAASRAELYFVQLPGGRPGVPTTAVVGGSTAADRETALRALADDVGGARLSLQASDNVFTRINQETSSHYVARLEVHDEDRPGTAYPIAMASHRAWMGLRFLPVAFLGGPPVPALPTTQALLENVDEFRQLPIRLAGFTSRADARSGTSLLITSVTEPVESGIRFRAATTVVFDATGARVAEDTAGASALAVTPLLSRFVAAPGRYLLRVAVVGADGRAGTVDCPVDARLTSAGPLSLGSLRTGVARPAAPGRMRGDSAPGLDPRLEFTNEPEALVFFDLYGGTPNEHVTVVMEVLRRADGPPIQPLEPHVLPARASDPGHYVVTALVDLASLLPGDYAIRATVGVAGQTPAVISETLRKVKAGSTR